MIISSASFAQSNLNANNIAYLFSNSVDVQGWEVVGQNPANIGFYHTDSIAGSCLNIGFLPLVSIPSINIGNNSFSWTLLNDNFFTGKTLTKKNKSELLDAIADDGVNNHYQLTQNIFKYCKNNVAYGFTVESIGNTQLPKSFMNFGINGNRFNDPLSIKDFDGEAIVYGDFSLNIGHELKKEFAKKYFENLYWGIGVDIILGSLYGEVEKVDGFITTKTDGLEIAGKATSKVTSGGLGFALDFGLTGKVNEKLTTSLSLQNPISLIKWGIFNFIKIDGRNSTEYEYDYYLNLESEQFFSDEIDSLLDAAVETNSTKNAGQFNTTLPASYNLSASYIFSEKVKTNFAIYGYLSNKYGLDFVPKLSTAITYYPVQSWPIIIGIGTSKSNQFAWSFGTGINKSGYRLNIGISQYGGMFNSSKGLFFAMDQSFYF